MAADKKLFDKNGRPVPPRQTWGTRWQAASKRSRVVIASTSAAILGLAAILGGLQTIADSVVQTEAEPDLPNIQLRIMNSSATTVRLSGRGEFFLWPPGSAANRKIGKYHLRRTGQRPDDIAAIPVAAGKTVSLVADILNDAELTQILLREDWDITLLFSTDTGGSSATPHIPFTADYIRRHVIAVVLPDQSEKTGVDENDASVVGAPLAVEPLIEGKPVLVDSNSSIHPAASRVGHLWCLLTSRSGIRGYPKTVELASVQNGQGYVLIKDPAGVRAETNQHKCPRKGRAPCLALSAVECTDEREVPRPIPLVLEDPPSAATERTFDRQEIERVVGEYPITFMAWREGKREKGLARNAEHTAEHLCKEKWGFAHYRSFSEGTGTNVRTHTGEPSEVCGQGPCEIFVAITCTRDPSAGGPLP